MCSSTKRATIEETVERGVSIAVVAEKHGISEQSLTRHIASHPRAKKGRRRPAPASVAHPARERHTADVPNPPRPHLPRAVTAPAAVSTEEDSPATSRSPTSATTARSKLDDLLVSLKKLADSIGQDATVQERIAVFRASVAPIKLLGQLTGELGASEASVAASPHYRRIRRAIVDALRDEHPAALKAVEAALVALEAGRAEDRAA